MEKTKEKSTVSGYISIPPTISKDEKEKRDIDWSSKNIVISTRFKIIVLTTGVYGYGRFSGTVIYSENEIYPIGTISSTWIMNDFTSSFRGIFREYLDTIYK